MPTFTVDNGPICICKPDRMVVKNLPMFLAGPYHSTSRSLCLHGKRTFHPVGHINVMDVLLHDVIATQPVEIVPVPHLVFHLRLPRFTWSNPHAAVVPVHLSAHDIPDVP